MNQILETPFNSKKLKLKRIKILLIIQLCFSVIFVVVIGIYILSSTFYLYKQEKYSNQILNNYSITKLYSNSFSGENLSSNENTDNADNSYVMGIIEIPKINIYYPIFSNYNEELLKVSPCKFYGPSQPGKLGNLCIAGHNYDTNKFFSKISTLNTNDEIIIYNNSNKKFYYFVYDIYEVKSDDLSPIYSFDKNSRQLTLITCNNLNHNRIIVKALLQ